MPRLSAAGRWPREKPRKMCAAISTQSCTTRVRFRGNNILQIGISGQDFRRSNPLFLYSLDAPAQYLQFFFGQPTIHAFLRSATALCAALHPASMQSCSSPHERGKDVMIKGHFQGFSNRLKAQEIKRPQIPTGGYHAGAWDRGCRRDGRIRAALRAHETRRQCGRWVSRAGRIRYTAGSGDG